MSAFYPGQRVRITWVVTALQALGREGTVTGPVQEAAHGSGLRWDGYPVSVDGIGPRDDGGWFCFRRDQLEPIVPDGLESIEEINALYEPSPEVVKS